jgi:multidrug efflux pump subunit AcrA (membrane-fusion protein)
VKETTETLIENEAPEARAIREAKAKIAAARAAREEAKAPARQKRELERLERQLKDELALAAAQDEHGDENVRAVTSESGLVVVKRDHHLKFKMFLDKGKFTTAVLEEQIARCLVHPTADELDAYIEKEPFLLQSVSGAIAVLAGAKSDEFTGK